MTQYRLDDNVGVADGDQPVSQTETPGSKSAGGPTFKVLDCPKCRKYYADWMKQLNTGRQRMLRRLHKGHHIHDDTANQGTNPTQA
mgnify:CR=1 FL=1